jgi:superfamily II DNA or RNA helicase
LDQYATCASVAGMPAHPLRPYQAEAIEAVEASTVQRPALVLPTGAGKTRILAEGVRRWHVPKRRIVVVAHRKELVEQNAAAIREAAPHLRVGMLIGQEHRHVKADVVSAMAQSLNLCPEIIGDVSMVMIDECHHGTAQSYRRILDHYGCFNADSGVRALGVTATMVRGDKGALGLIWQDVVYTKPISELIGDGYLVRPFGKRVRVRGLDLNRVKVQGGDLQEKALGAALEDAHAPEAIAEAYREHASGRQGIVFMPTVHSAEATVAAFQAAGFTCAGVYGSTERRARREILDAYRAGRIQVLINAMVLTEGTDLPMTSCIVVARPTRNPGLYIQMVGRGLRLDPANDKTDCLILDIAGVTATHRLASPINLFTEEEIAKELPDGFEDWIEDADDEVEAEPEPPAAPEITWSDLPDKFQDYAGRIEVEEIDLFHGDGKDGISWEITPGGVWHFVVTGNVGGAVADGYMAVLPGAIPGTWDVLRAGKEVGVSTWIARAVPTLAGARSAAELSAGTRARRRAHIRKRMYSASDAQARYARDLGINVTSVMTSGEIGHAIDIKHASVRLDGAVPLYARR